MSFVLEPRLLFDASLVAQTASQNANSHSAQPDTAQSTQAHSSPDGTQSGDATQAAEANDPQQAAHQAEGSDQPDGPGTPTQSETAPRPDAVPIDSILFVDPRVSGWQALADSAPSATKVVVIDPTLDGIAQVTKALEGMHGIQEVDFLTYGQSGQIELGSSTITDATLQARAADIAGWRDSLADNAQIKFWGCDVGAGAAGEAFVNDLHALTGVGVGASIDATGLASLGGDWVLERTAGTVDSSSPFSAEAIQAFTHVLDAPVPTVTLSGPTDVLLGSSFTQTLTFDNSAANGVGFGPFVELFVPAHTGTGADHAVSLTGATYLGSALSFQAITLSDAIAGHVGTVGAYNPLLLDASGQPTFVAAPSGFQAGDVMYVITLPFGSFTANQPVAEVSLNFSLDSRSNVTSSGDLRMAAIGGFQYGVDALNNPTTDPSIVGTSATTNLNVNLVNVTTRSVTTPGEGETATGSSFPAHYVVTVTPAPAVAGAPITDFVFTLQLPDDVQYTGGTIAISGGGVAEVVPSSSGPGGTLVVRFATLSSEQTIDIPIFVPQADATSGQVLDPNTGAPVPVTLTYAYTYAGDAWTPVAGAFTPAAQPVSGSGDGATLAFTAKSVAVQVDSSIEVDNATAGFSPGDIIEYTINFQVSDFFDLNNLTLADLLGDGMTLLPGMTPVLTVFRNGVAVGTINFGAIADGMTTDNGQTVSTSGANAFWSYAARDGSGQTAINFDVGALLQSETGSSLLAGGPSGTYGTVTFYAQVLDKYTDSKGGASLRENDTTTNSVTGSGTVTSHFNGDASPVSDTSTTTDEIAEGNLTMQIVAVDGVPPGSTVTVQAGQLVTYTLTYDLTQGDYGNLDLTAYLPLPVFELSAMSAGNGTDANTFTVLSNPSGGTPTASIDTVGNSVTFHFGDHDSTTNAGSQRVTVQFTVRASDRPFADGLALTSQAQAGYTNAEGVHLADAAIRQQVMQEPSLTTKTGIVSVVGNTGTPEGGATYTGDTGSGTSNPTSTFDPAGDTSGIFPNSSAVPDTITDVVNQNAAGADASDSIRIVQTVENVGHGVAYDVIVRGTLPTGYTAADVTNLKVTLGDGTVLSFTGDATAFFSATGIQIHGADGTTNSVVLQGTGDATNRDILFVTYDLKLSANQTVASTLTATGAILNWSAGNDAPGFVTNGVPVGGSAANLTDAATVSTSNPTFVKAITAGDNPHVTLNSVVVGETITYTFTLTLPEGRMSNVTFTDTLPAFLTNIQLGAVVFGSGVSADGASVLNLAGGVITANFGNITNVNVDANGTVTFTFTARIADSTNVNGTTITNAGTLNWDTSNSLTGQVTATERDPLIAASLSSNASGPVHSGQVITYTFTITNNGAAPSEGFLDTITLPSGLTWVPGSLALSSSSGSITGLAVNDGGHTISIDRLAVGASATFTFQATVNNDLPANTTLQVTTPGTYTSMPGTVTGERSYNATTTNTVTTGVFEPTLVIVDQSNATDTSSPPSQASPQDTADVVPGELVRMKVYVEIPTGLNPGVTFDVNLPPGLQYVGNATIALASSDGQLSSSTIDPTGSNAAIQVESDAPGFNVLTYVPTAALDPGAVTVGAGSGGDITFNLGNVQNNANSSVPNYAIIEFTVVVTNEAANQGGTNLATVASVGSNSDGATVTVREPNVTIAKTVTSIDQATGVVTWQVTVSNTGNAVAYNVALNDSQVPGDNQQAISGLISSGDAEDLVIGSGDGSSSLQATMTLGIGESHTFTYQTTVTDRTQGVADATATVTYASLDDTTGFTTSPLNPDGFYGATYTATGTGAAGSSTGERTGQDGTSGLNNYTAGATIGLGVATGNVWNDIGSALNGQDLGHNSAVDTHLQGVVLTGSWGPSSSTTVTTDTNGSYSFLLPTNVTPTISAPLNTTSSSTGGGTETLVYSTNGTAGTTFNHEEPGLTAGQHQFTITVDDVTAISGINFAYRLADTAPEIETWGDNTPAGAKVYTMGGPAVTLSNGSTGVEDVQLDSLVANGLGDYAGTVLTIQRDVTANADDVFGGNGTSGSGLFFDGANVRFDGVIIGTYTMSNGTLTVTFGAGRTGTDVRNMLNNVTYSNSGDADQLDAGIVINATLSDHNTQTGTVDGNAFQGTGGVMSVQAQILLEIAPAATAAAFQEPNNTPAAGNAVQLVPAIEINDQFTQIVLTISPGSYQNGEDALSFLGVPATGNITGTWNPTNGTLTLTSAGGTASAAQWQAALRSVTYVDSSDTPTVGARTVTFSATATNAQVIEGTLATVTVAPANDSPVLNNGVVVTMPDQVEDNLGDPTGAVGFLVSSLVGEGSGPSNVADSDHAVAGLAITTADTSQGSWWVSTDGGATWAEFASDSMAAVSNANALHLVADANTRLYFQPAAADWNGTIANALTFRAWDQFSPATPLANGTLADIGGSGFGTGINTAASAYSAATVTIPLTVDPVNDAPVASGTATLPSVTEDTNTPPGATVASLFTPTFNDARDTVLGGSSANTLAGVAIVGNAATAAQGVWRYSTDGGATWTTIPTTGLSDTAAIILPSTARIDFLPAGNWNGTPGNLTVRLIDGSGTANTPVAFQASADVSSNGGTTAVSAAVVVLNTTVDVVNDAPVASGTATVPVLSEDPAGVAGTPVSSLLGQGTVSYSDTTDTVPGGSTGTPAAGIAIIGNAATAAQGVWQYSTDGTSWSAIPSSLSDNNAFILPTSAQVRFVPNADWNGTPGALTARISDGTGGLPPTGVTNISSGIGGTGQWSDGTITIGTTTPPVNDAPVASGTATLPAVTEDATTPPGATVTSLFTPTFNDARDTVPGGSSANTLAGIAIVGNAATAAQGVWRYSTDGGATWTTIPTTGLSDTAAIILPSTARIDFLPADNWNGTPGNLTVRLIDGSGTGDTPVAFQASADVSSNGGTTAVSAAVVALNTTVTAVNDAPVASGSVTLATAGSTVTSLFTPVFSDTTDTVTGGSTEHPFAGIAIVGNDADPATQGVWQYSLDGGATYQTIPTALSDGSAMILPPAAQIQFVGVAGYTGTPGGLTVRVIDGSAGPVTFSASTDVTTNGGTTALSAATVPFNTIVSGTVGGVFQEPNNGAPADVAVPVNGTVVLDLSPGTVYTSATFQITGNYQDGEDLLVFAGSASTGEIVGVFDATTGTMTLTSANGATPVQWQAALRNIRYYNASDTPDTTNRTVTMDIVQEGMGTLPLGTSTVTILPANDSPILNNGIVVTLPDQVEDNLGDPTGAVGFLVSSLVGEGSGPSNVTDSDHSLAGLAITTANTSQGSWWVSTDGGATWTQFASGSMTAVSNANALHLVADGNTRLYFQPATTDWNGTIANALTFRAWDQFSPATPLANGTLADIGGSGFGTGINTAASAYSSATVTIPLTVDPVNDAPVATGDVALPPYVQGNGTPTASTVEGLFTSVFNDVRDTVPGGSSANTLAGIAIVGNAATAAQGEWRYSTDGGTTWTTIASATLSDRTAIILPSTALLQFMPTGGFGGTPGALQVRLIDSSSGPVTYSASSDVTTNGGMTPISGNTVALNTAVTLPPPTSSTGVPPNVIPPSDYTSNGFWGGWNGTDRLRDLGGMPADWLVGSNVYRTMLVNQPGVANVSTDVFYGTAPRQTLRYEASSISGGPLPPWLFFDPNLLRFSGTPPEGAEGTYDFRVVATDRLGRQATADVHIIVLREPRDLLNLLRPMQVEEAPTVPPASPPAEAPAAIDVQPQPAGPGTDGTSPTPPAVAPAPARSGDGAQLQMPVPAELQASPDFGLSPQLREHAQAGRMARARALLDALAV
jgi:uncharacterized repeat protein (TIGR01451 family)